MPVNVPQAYFYWLYEPFYDPTDPTSWFMTVCDIMHQTIFTPLVPHDENRVADAAELRNDFVRSHNQLGPLELSDLMSPDTSVFEVLIALAKRADFMVPLTPKVWFRIFLENLNLDSWTDERCASHSTWPVQRAINAFNSRTYSKTGRGGIFPLRRPKEDQRHVELWYQMGAYMTENAMY